jgi:isoquinoline 1-oxidoreductase beta subunit
MSHNILSDFWAQNTRGGISRRDFLFISGAVGGGLLLGATIPGCTGGSRTSKVAEFAFTLFARVSRSGAVTILAPNPEMGQGVFVALPMIFAEEFGVNWSDVNIGQADYVSGAMGSQASGGSFSVLRNWMPLRQAGAAARQLFVRAAADRWQVPAAECDAANSRVVHVPSGNVLSYGDLAEKAATIPLPNFESVTLKDEAAFGIIGTSPSDDAKARVVAGQQQFGIDVKVPSMRYAVYQKAPVFDADVVSANIDKVRSMPGVSHVFVLKGAPRLPGVAPEEGRSRFDDEIRGGVAIVADTWWHAQKARKALEVEWTIDPHDDDSSAGWEQEAVRLMDEAPTNTVREDGDVDAALAMADSVVSARYFYPLLAHATMEPQNCTAWFHDGMLEIWAPTQHPDSGTKLLAANLGIAAEDITIHLVRCGGGFGRRLANDYMLEAAMIAREAGLPVKLIWSREDDIQHDVFRPPGYHDFKAGLDAEDRLIAFRAHAIGSSRTTSLGRSVPGGEIFPAGFVPNYGLYTSRIEVRVPLGPLRAPGDNGFAYVFQSFLDEIANASGKDPFDLQIELLGNADPENRPLRNPYERFGEGFIPARMLGVLESVRDRSGWGQRAELPNGTGLGMACFWSHLGYVAQVHKVSVDMKQKIRMRYVWVAVDVGHTIVHPSNAANQVEGAILDGISATLAQKISIQAGHANQSNFHDYPLLRNSNLPNIDIEFIKTDYPLTGLGEPAYPPTMPAFCNAIFAATGKRIRRLPLTDSGFSV